MWTRSELKQKGQNAFLRNYWWCVLAALILMLIASRGSSSGGSANQNNNQNTAYQYNYVTDEDGNILSEFDIDEFMEDGELSGEIFDNTVIDNTVTDGLLSSILNNNIPSGISALFNGIMGIASAAAVTVFALLAILVGIALSVLIFNPIQVGGRKFFINNSRAASKNSPEKTKASELLYAFKDGNYGTIVTTMFAKSLFEVLWTLCLIIPGIVKAYEYRMIPYLLADRPDMDRREVFETSRSMMDGHKMDAFILDLSFIGWKILSAFTLNLSGIFFSNPYQEATNAELYLRLLNEGRDDYIGYDNTYTAGPEDQKFW